MTMVVVTILTQILLILHVAAPGYGLILHYLHYIH